MEACVVACNSSPSHFPPANSTTGTVFQLSGGSEKAREARIEEVQPWTDSHDLSMYYKDLRMWSQYTDLLPVALQRKQEQHLRLS